MGDSRGLGLAIKGGYGDLHDASDVSSELCADLGDASLDSVDLEIRDVEQVGEFLTAELLGLANLLDSASNKRRLGSHEPHLSETDRLRKRLSAQDVEAGDTVRDVKRTAHDLTFEECERWMSAVGYSDDGRPDWARLLREARVKSHKDTIKNRWLKGQAQRDRLKIRARLEEAERRRSRPSDFGGAIMALEEWQEIGARIAAQPEVFHKVFARVRDLALEAERLDTAAQTKEQAERAIERLMSPFLSVSEDEPPDDHKPPSRPKPGAPRQSGRTT
jgi:hypothetical protein